MEITIAGSGTVVPRIERRQSCVIVRTGGETLVFDLGSGAVRGMLNAGLNPFAVDRVFFTHFHPDHTVDVVPLLFAMKYGAPEERTRPLHIAGPEPFLEFWDSLQNVWGRWMFAEHTNLTELSPNDIYPLELRGCRLSWRPVQHRPESIGYRLESDGRAFVYPGDTEYCESVVELARGANTLLIECSFPDESPVAGHLTPGDVARIASEAGVERVVLTHIYPAVDRLDPVSEISRGFGGEVILAEDGLVFEV